MTLQRQLTRSRDRGGRFVDTSARIENSADRRRLTVESLEPRLLLYAPNGGAWPHPELVTVSFMPDGTNIGGLPSVLQTTLNLRFPTGTWQKEILRGFQSYAANANINFSVAGDDGSPFGSCGGSGSDCNMQGDSNFGDVRIGGFALAGPLGLSMLPPPMNGDTTAGDFFLDSLTIWNIGSSYDLYTVAAHEAGHSIGLDHSALTSAVMYTYYNGVKSSLTADDIGGIQSIYGARPQDGFDAASPNNVKDDATAITSYIDGNKQVKLNNLDITATTDADWYKITTPSGGASTMEVRVQSTGLSLFAPRFTLFKGSTNKGTVSGGYNSTVSQTESINNGQNWFIKVEGAEANVFGTGKYALEINMGTQPMTPVRSPNTATPATGYGGNGSPDLSLPPCDSDHGRSDDNGQGHSPDTAGPDELPPTANENAANHNAADGTPANDVRVDNGSLQHSPHDCQTIDELLDAGLSDVLLPLL